MHKPDISAEVLIQVQFYDLDPMQVVWHGNYFRFLEIARCALLDKLGYNYIEMRASGFAWPIVDSRLKFIRPLVFGQRARVCAALEEYENRLKIAYEIWDEAHTIRHTRGYTIQVAVELATGEMCFQSPRDLVDRVLAC